MGVWAIGLVALAAMAGGSGALGLWLSFSAFLSGALVEVPGLREPIGRPRDSGLGSLVALCLVLGIESWARTHLPIPSWLSHLDPFRTSAGIAILVLAVFLRWRARRDLRGGFRYSLRVEPGQVLVTSGLYAHLRHPAYLGAHLFLVAVPLAGGSLLGLAASLAALPATLARIRREENLLEARWGIAFRDWKRRAPSRLIPRFRAWEHR